MNLYFGIQIAPYRVDFCNALHSVYGYAVFHLEGGEDLGFNRELVRDSLTFEDLRYPRPGLKLKSFRYFSRLLDRYDPETVLVSEFSPTALIMIVLSRLRKRRFRVVSLCDDSLDMIRGNDFTLRHRLARRLIPPFLDNLILPSDETAQWYRSHFDKGVCMPIIADEERFRSLLDASLPLVGQKADELQLRGRRVVLFVGRMVSLKNVDLLLRAFAAFKLPARLVLVGDGPCRSQWEQLAASLGVDACFVGSQSGLALAVYFQLADILVLPSEREAFGAVINEALLSGARVLVSERAGSRVLVDSGNGRIVEPTVAALGESLDEMLPTLPVRTEYGMRPSLMRIRFREQLAQAISSL